MLSSRAPIPELIEIGRRFYARGWVMGTSGNFSSVISTEPLRLLITSSSVHKGYLSESQFLLVDGHGEPLRDTVTAGDTAPRRPSAETLLHIEIVRRRGAGAVLHTHSVWSTILSEYFALRGAVEIEGYEMLKGLAGIPTHETREVIPIIDNDQDMTRLSTRLAAALDAYPDTHAVLLRKHGVYTWGATLSEAERHIEILEFLFEAVGRSLPLGTMEAAYGTLENS